MRPTIRGGAIALVAALLVATSVAADAERRATAKGQAKAVKIVKGLATSWSPSVVRLTAGGRVRWRSVSGSHFLKAYGGNWRISESLPQGASTARRFSKKGVYRFRCTIHSSLIGGQCSGMCGKVVSR